MRSRVPTLMAASLVLTACEAHGPVEPSLDVSAVAPAEARSPNAGCRATPLSSSASGDVTADDCLNEAGTRHQDVFLVAQKRFGTSDLSGSSMLTFTVETDFPAVVGASGFGPGRALDPFYGAVGANGTAAFSVISDSPTYAAWIAGSTLADAGAYSVTTSVGPSLDTCESQKLVFLHGDVSFTSHISDATACEGTVAFGEYIGAPLIYQYWYYVLQQGETLTVTATGLGADPSLVLAAIDFGSSTLPARAEIDFPDAPGDTDRSVTFTADRTMYLYLEVSAAPGVSSPYTLTVEAP